MAKVTIELNSAGIQELLKSPEIASVCESEAQKMTQAAGVDYIPKIITIRERKIADGYKKETANDKKKICPKCGHSHPNCRCKV